MYFIYKFLNKENKVLYIGKTQDLILRYYDSLST